MTDLLPVIPKLHLSLHETRRELDATRDLAARLARALDGYVDAAYGLPRRPNWRAVAQALHEAREKGLL